MKYGMVKQLERSLVAVKAGQTVDPAEVDACLAILDRETKILQDRSERTQRNFARAIYRYL